MKHKSTILVISYESAGSDWPSMGEIIPALEKTWAHLQSGYFTVDFFFVGKDQFFDLPRKALSAQLIIFLSTMPDNAMANIMKFVRVEMKLSTPFFIYGHDLSTVGGVRLFWSGLDKVLTDQDLWIFTNHGDQQLWAKCFPKSQSTVLPFPLLRDLPQQKKVISKNINFLFVGRISEQKMLHFTLWGLAQFKELYPDRKFNFHIVGAADFLGSPNMGISGMDYQSYLENLVLKLGITKEVIFHGTLSREEIDQRFFSCPHIFVSPSLHSDENFGAAVLRGLSCGGKALLSDWGGHREFKKYFPKAVSLLPVIEDELGPNLRLDDFLTRVEEILDRPSAKVAQKVLANFHPDKQAKVLAKLVKKMSGECASIPLTVSGLAMQIHKQHQVFWKKNRRQTDKVSELENLYYQVFANYQDPLALEFFKGYGMNKFCGLKVNYKKALPPWIKVKNDNWYICDPHRGNFIFNPKKTDDVKCLKRWLVEKRKKQTPMPHTSKLESPRNDGANLPHPN